MWEVKATLLITNYHAGDNYQVRATGRKPADAAKPFDQQPATWGGDYKISGALVAWKRIYLEIDQMYQKGATLLAGSSADGDVNPDVLRVDNTSDFNVGDEIILWHRDQFEIESEVVDKTDTTISVPDVGRNLPDFTGVRLKDSVETFGTVSRRFLPNAYGVAPDGSDGGTFVEFKEVKGWIVPKFHVLPSVSNLLDRTSVEFCARWFKNNATSENFFQLLSSRRGADFGGVADPPTNASTVCIDGADATWAATSAAHEIGHLLNLLNDKEGGVILHVDNGVNVRNHNNSDECFMTYNENRTDENVELDLECIYHVRKFYDPL